MDFLISDPIYSQLSQCLNGPQLFLFLGRREWKGPERRYLNVLEQVRKADHGGDHAVLWVFEIFLWAVLVGQICLQCGRPGFDPWVGKIPWRREWLPTLVFLSGESHGQRSLVGYSPPGRKKSDMTEQLTVSLSYIRLAFILEVKKKTCIYSFIPVFKKRYCTLHVFIKLKKLSM